MAVLVRNGVPGKFCSTCKEWKPLTEFPTDPTHPPSQGGRHCRCKACFTELRIMVNIQLRGDDRCGVRIEPKGGHVGWPPCRFCVLGSGQRIFWHTYFRRSRRHPRPLDDRISKKLIIPRRALVLLCRVHNSAIFFCQNSGFMLI